jgi:hypothetical protein
MKAVIILKIPTNMNLKIIIKTHMNKCYMFRYLYIFQLTIETINIKIHIKITQNNVRYEINKIWELKKILCA